MSNDECKAAESRRKFLETAGKSALVAPAVALLLAASHRQAMATYGGGHGGGGGGHGGGHGGHGGGHGGHGGRHGGHGHGFWSWLAKFFS